VNKFQAYINPPVLPWEDKTKQDRIFLFIIFLFLFIGILLGYLVSSLPYTERSQAEKEKIPERLATVIKKRKQIKPPPPKPKPKQTVKSEEKKEPKKKPTPKKPRKPKNVAKTEQQKKDRAAAQKKLNEVTNALAELQNLQIAVNTKPLSVGGAQAKSADRKLITARGTSGSGGIEVSNNASADASGFGGSGQGSELVAIATTQVESNIQANEKKSQSKKSSEERALEDIRKIFDLKKGSLFTLYSRALRKDPTLQGSIVLHLVISPEGTVTSCTLVSSELNDDALIRRIISRVKTFNFGSEAVKVWDNNYTINLVPS